MSRLLAHLGHGAAGSQCPLSESKPTDHCCCRTSERNSNSAPEHRLQAPDEVEEKIPYFLGEVQSSRENRPEENEKRSHAASAVRNPRSKPMRKQQRQRVVLTGGESFAKRCWRSESDCNLTFSIFSQFYVGVRPYPASKSHLRKDNAAADE